MMTPLRTYADKLKEGGYVTTDSFNCPKCKLPHPAFAIVETEPGVWQCSTCHITAQQMLKAEAEQEALSELGPWETPKANDVRQQRTLLQEKWRWAVMPDSPLTPDAQQRVMVFLKALNTLTIEYPAPDDIVWPLEPSITSGDYGA